MKKQSQQHSSLSATMQKKAERLAFLLAQSAMPQEQKEGWINVLPIMDEQQVDTLIDLLEQEHAGYVESSKEFLEDVKQLEQSFAAKVTELKEEERKMIDAFIQSKLAAYKNHK
ncbi:MAG TPA: hypothetical protein VJB65_01120 [Patescibacteria group bacterium]|nr:hypothetical protein [Patescibacteria group bacterium]